MATLTLRWFLDGGSTLTRTAACTTRSAAGAERRSCGMLIARGATVRLLVERGADLADRAFDDEGPTPLDCALWGVQNNRAEDGDYPGTVEALLAEGAPTRHEAPTGDTVVDAVVLARLRPDPPAAT